MPQGAISSVQGIATWGGPLAGGAALLAGSRLELEPCSKLHLAEIAGGRFHFAESSAKFPACIWKCEARGVGRVEHLSPNLQLHILADLELLRQ